MAGYRYVSLVVVTVLALAAGGRVGAAPSAPSLLGPADRASVTVPLALSWSAVTDPSGILGYNWQVSRSSNFATLVRQDSTAADATSDIVSGLEPGTYFWRVQVANGAFEQSAWSAPASFTVTGASAGTPGTPTLNPTVGYATFHPWEAIKFTWSSVPDAALYFHMVSNDPAFPVGPTPAGITTFWTDNISTATTGYVHALAEGTWYAKVYAVSADGIFSMPSNVISYTVFYNNPVPNPPALTAPVGNPTLSLPFALRWQHVANPQPGGYEVQISPNAQFTTNEAPLGVQLTNPEFQIKSLTSGQKFWRVRSHQGLRSQNADGSTTNAVTAWSATGTFTVNPAPPTPVSVIPVRNPLYSGDQTAVEVQLTAGAPSGGASVALSSSHPAIAPVPATLAMPATNAWNQFQMTVGQVTVPTVVTITATLNGVQSANQFTVNPPSLKSLTISGGPKVSGGAVVSAILSLNGRAPAGGALVTLESNSQAVTPPSSVTIPAGTCCASVSMTTAEVSTNTPVTITAKLNGASVQSLVTVTAAPAPASITLFPSTVNGGEGSVDGTVTIASPASFNQVLRVGSSSPVVPSTSAVIPANSTRGSFRLFPGAVSTSTVVTISVTGGGVTRSVNLTVTPAGAPAPAPALSSFAVNPTSVAGGTSASGTVTLASAAPAGGTVVVLGSNQPGAASVPASLTIPAGATAGAFTVTTFANPGTTAQLSASLGDTTLFASIGVGPAAPVTPAAPSLLSPGDAVSVAQPVLLDWSDVANAASYEVQVDDSSTIAAPFVANPTTTASQASLSNLPGRQLWWRVRARNAAGTFGPFSSVRRFTPQAAAPAPGQPATLTVTASGRSGERVVSTPAGVNVAVGSSGSASFSTGTSITLTVSNGRDAIWSGACSSGGNKAKSCTFTLGANASVAANVQ